MEQVPESMVVGVRFSKVGKIYDFESNGIADLKVGDMVVVETSRGWQLGSVAKVLENPEPPAEGWKSIDRRATPRDLLLRQMWQQREADVVANTKTRATELRLQGIKIVGAEYSFDGSRLTILFSSETEEKYDLKSLRQDMQKVFAPSQVEMRQIGPRDVAKMTCGMGACGLEKRCCCSFLTEFSSISIRMAKEQGISLTPTEITGMCGRLRCCLIYEYETYVDARATLPKRNKRVRTPQGEGKVIDVAPLRGAVIVDVPEQGYREYPLSEIVVLDETGQPAAPQTAGRSAMSEPQVVEVEHSAPEDGFIGIFNPRPPMEEPQRSPQENRPEKGGGRGPRENRPALEGRGERGPRGERGREDRSGQDRPAQERGGQERGGQGRGPQDRGNQDRAQQDRPGQERSGQDRGGRGQRGGGNQQRGGQERGGREGGGQSGEQPAQRQQNAGGRPEGNQRQHGPRQNQPGGEPGRGGQRPNQPRRRPQPEEGSAPAEGGTESPAVNEGNPTSGRPQGPRRPNRDSKPHGHRGGREHQRRKGQNNDSDGSSTNNPGRSDVGEE